MVRDGDSTGIGRRRFVRGAAAGLLAAAVPAGAAAARESDGPVRATGKRIHQFERDGDEYRHYEQFTSPDLRKAFGEATVEYDPVTLPAERVPAEVRESDGPSMVEYRDVGVFGTFDQHATAEQSIHAELNASDDAETDDAETDDHSPSYFGPLYVYKSGSVSERSAPVNVAWRRYLGFDAEGVRSKMVDDGDWGNIVPSSDRYILYYDGSDYVSKKQDKHVKKSTGITAQWHGRLYDVPTADEEDYGVVSAAHHDPWDHGHITNPDWQFAGSRQEFLDAWESLGSYGTENQDAYNGSDFDSSNGMLGIVY
ncbi:hypothetical protein [Halorussus halobius]|uniref:hypothetical protein n=1 Tax=Halorussus halobius TaxID=1710537 RepID=UPI00109228D6|nr:hypothetical protein [Halorussus halobius]